MAVFDLASQRMCIRVVYDGVANAGKTTNLKQLCGLFATQHATEVYSPGEAEGRTLFFDWVQIAAGAVCGFPLVCQVITVPGQVVLTPRRRKLLASADVVVYVTESHPHALARARDGLVVLDEVARERGESIPMVVQANKQDQAGVVHGQGVLEALELVDVTVLEAIAMHGVGVVDTFVAAVRAAKRSLEAMSEAGRLRVAVQRSETSDELYARLSDEPVDPEWAIEMLLEQASDAFLLASHEMAAPRPSFDASRDDRPPVTERSPGEAEPFGRSSSAPASGSRAKVPLPDADVPTGFIWPAHTGRKTLATLAVHRQLGATADLDEDGNAALDAGTHLLRTSTRARFEDTESARHALVRSAREWSQLGPLLVPETVLVVEQGADGASWLWTVSANLPTVTSVLEADEGDIEALLRRFGRAIVDAVRVAHQHGLYLDGHPSHFGEQEGVLRFCGDVLAVDDESRSPGHVIARALVGLDACGAPLDTVLETVAAGLVGRTDRAERASLAKRLAEIDCPSWSPRVREALHGLGQRIGRVSEAA